ncbi:MAG: DUF1513 domain-containing protein [Planctomycetota bacterium]
MKSSDRRNFLKTAAAATGAVALSACSNSQNASNSPASNDAEQPCAPDAAGFEPNIPVDNPAAMTYGTMLCGGHVIKADTGEKKFLFTQISLDRTLKEQEIPKTESGGFTYFAHAVVDDIGFLAHGVIENPLTRRGVLVFEKKGPGGAEVDLKESKIINRIPPSADHEFYGHGGYSSDGKTVFATEYHEETYVGKMTVRDATDFKVIGDFPTYGEWPHDCQFIDDGKIVAITNGGGSVEEASKSASAIPNVAYVEVATGKLIEKVEWQDSPQLNAGHLLVSPSGDLIIAHSMREGLHTKKALGGLSIRLKGGDLKTMIDGKFRNASGQVDNITKHMNGETLSLALHGNILAATNPYALFEGKPNPGVTTFWDLKKQKFLGPNYFDTPRGVAVSLNGEYWVITSSTGTTIAGVTLVQTSDGKQGATFEAATQGSHVYIHDYPI